MPELKFIVKNANGRILFKDAGGNIIQDRPDYEAVGLTGELYPESITVGAGENTYSFVIPANGGITYTSVGGTPTSYTGNAAGLLVILSANFFNASTGSGGGGGGDATAAKQDEQTAFLEDLSTAAGTPTDSPTTNPFGASTQTALQKGIFANGLRVKSFEQVVDKSTNTEYLRAVDFDPNTPPAEIKYLDPVTGLQVAAPSNPVQPIASNVILEDAIGFGTDVAETDPNATASLLAFTKGLLSYQSNARQIGLSFIEAVDLGLVAGASVVRKSGKNFDVDIATTPESVWNGGGLYTGFPTGGASATLQVVSSSTTDVGTLTVVYLDSVTATGYKTDTIAVNGTTLVNSTFTAYRVHSASYSSTANTSTQLNVGTITVRYAAAPATVFIAMPPARNQSYMSGYTIPFGKRGYLLPTNWRVGGSAGNTVEGVMYIRPYNGAPRFRRNCTPSFGAAVKDDFEGGIWLDALTDVMPTVVSTNANNVLVEAAYTIIIINA
jgi:hypothetical protein